MRARPSGVEEALLSGFGYTTTDQAVARDLLAAEPAWGWRTAAHRRFQRAALGHLVATGHTQVLDLGCGHPSGIGSSYQWITDYEDSTGQRLRYVGIDADPLVTTIMAARHDGRPHHHVRLGDLTHLDQLLDTAGIFPLLDPTAPIAVLATSVLQHLHHPQKVLSLLRQRLCVGSAVAISHPDLPVPLGESLHQTVRGYQAAVAPWYPRPASAAADILTTWHHDPGDLTPVGHWTPPGTPASTGPHNPTAQAPGWAVIATA